MNLTEIKIDLGAVEKYKVSGITIHRLLIPVDGYDSLVGIDPGMHFGISVLSQGLLRVMWGSIPTQKEPGMAGALVLEMMKEMDIKTEFGVVEGAAYHAKFGQVGLQEVRFAFYYALYLRGAHVRILPPATVRKLAFGSGKETAADIYPTLNHNAADSIGCVIAAKEYLCQNPLV